MERHLGRKLRSDEEVHHIDGNRQNNKLKNLMVCSRQEHARIHKEQRMKIKENEINEKKTRKNKVFYSIYE